MTRDVIERPRVLTIVLAGGQGSRLGPLTNGRAKPALPFGGMFRLIDIVLSNLAHSGLQDVWVVEQYEPHDLNEHLANGRPWDLDRTHGGLRILPMFERDGEGGDASDGSRERSQGNADALVRQRRFIESFGADVVVTTSADHLYRLDLRDAVDTHLANEADLTIVSTEPPADDDPTRFAWIGVDDEGRVTDFEYKPNEPDGDAVCTEVFVFRAAALLEQLARWDGGESAGDYGDHLIPALLAGGRVVDHRLDGYWRDLGTLPAYHRGHMELLGDDPALVLDDPQWPILTGSVTNGAARFIGGGAASSSLIGPGSLIAGTVAASVIGRGVVIEAGATVRDSVVLDEAVIRAGADLRGAIVDDGTEVGPDTPPTDPEVDLDGDALTVFSRRGVPLSQ